MKYIFVDCFDTILKRTVSPEKVKIVWAEKVSEYVSLSVDVLYRLFVAAEQALVLKNKNDRESEWEISELFQLVKERIEIYNLADSLPESFVDICLSCYEKVELDLLCVNKSIEKRIRKLKANKDTMVFLVSDFYCGKEYLVKWFRVLGIEDLFDDFFVSCDYNMTKRKGSMYEFIIKKFSIYSPSDITMIGDNKYSDYKIPKQMGINTIRVYNKSECFSIVKEKDYSAYCKQYLDIFNEDNGFSNYSFELFLFIERLVDNLLKRNENAVYFLSREGEFLKKLFDFYTRGKNLNIKSYYFYASRNSLLLANLKIDDLSTYKFISNEINDICIYDFLKTLQFSDENINTIEHNVGLDFKKRISSFFSSPEITTVLSDRTYREDLNTRISKAKNGLWSYLSSINVSKETKQICIVDVGWKGTMQDILWDFFEGNVFISGYYIGVKPNAVVNKRNIKYGLLFSNIPVSMNSQEKIFAYGYWNYEQVLRATHPRVIGYSLVEHNKQTVIQFENNNEDVKFYQSHVKNLQGKIFEKFRKLCEIPEPENRDLIISSYYRKMMLSIKYRDYLWICDCADNHFDSFGTLGYLGSNRSIKGYIRYMLGVFKHLGFFQITRRKI